MLDYRQVVYTHTCLPTSTRRFAVRSVWGLIALRAPYLTFGVGGYRPNAHRRCVLSFLYILSFSYYPQRCAQRRSLSRCPSAVAAAKPACIEPAAGNRLADTAACVDHAQPAAGKAPTSVTDTFLNSSVVLLVV